MKRTTSHKPTRSKLTLLHQLCNLIPTHLVPRLARDTGVDAQARTFRPWSHVVSLLYAQLTHSLGLNDVCDALRLLSWLWLGWRTEEVEKLAAGLLPESEAVLKICQAALIPCVIGMALDGVLFKAAVAVPMFILIELGASTRDSGVGQTQSRQSPAPSH